MPGIDGPELCRRIRQDPSLAHMYVILLTGRRSSQDVVAGLDAGADDYVVKPFDADELRARVHVGIRVLKLQERLAERVAELQTALLKVKQLSGLLPICSYCKRIRSDRITGSRSTATSPSIPTPSSVMESALTASKR